MFEKIIAALAAAKIRLPALIAAKRAAGRPKDREHLLELEALAKLKKQN